jgi:uncharacterized membrane protein
MGIIGLAVGVLVAVIALILVQTLITNSLPNFTSGSVERTVVTFIVPLMAIGVLVTVAYFGTRGG